MAIDLIDIGANLTHDSFADDRDEVIERASDAGVKRIILTGSSEQASRDAAALADSMPGTMYATTGVHPHHASEYSDSVHDTLSELVSRDSVVAVGECGLDYFRNFSPPEDQRDAFRRQLEIAAETGLPLFLHQRDAHADFIEILKPAMGNLSRAVAHCFTGGAEELSACLDLGLYIGITGWVCDERRGQNLINIVGQIPLDRLIGCTLLAAAHPRPETENAPQRADVSPRGAACCCGRDGIVGGCPGAGDDRKCRAVLFDLSAHFGTSATTRAGPPEPPSIFIGSAMTSAPVAGN
jgi:TatD DNase family protein